MAQIFFLYLFKANINYYFVKFVPTNLFPSPLFCCWIQDPRYRIRDPEWIKIRIRDKHLGSATVLGIKDFKCSQKEKKSRKILLAKVGDGNVSPLVEPEHGLIVQLLPAPVDGPQLDLVKAVHF